jgi:transcriptional regulator with XRE-family HTH domain
LTPATQPTQPPHPVVAGVNAWLNKHGQSQTWLAKATGIDRATLSLILAFRRDPTYPQLLLILDATGKRDAVFTAIMEAMIE